MVAIPKFSIVVDDSADHFKNFDVVRLPFKILHEGNEVELSQESICRFMEEGEVFTTSQVSPKAFLDAFRREDRPILCLTLSNELSGTYQSAKVAARMSGKDVVVIDSGSIATGLGLLLERAVELQEAGATRDEAVKELEEYRKRIRIYFTLKNMSYLRRSGRLSSVFAGFGDFIGINPVMLLKDGKAKVIHVSRGYEKAAEWIVKKVRGKKLLAGYICSKELGRKVAEELGTEAIELCATIACHVGPAILVGVVE